MAIEITIVAGAPCPGCGGGDEFHNRPKVGDSDGTWWWRCYNGICPVRSYNPETGGVERENVGAGYLSTAERIQKTP